MGEKKEEEKKEEAKEEKKEGDEQAKKEEEAPAEIVFKVDMHCEACARKVARALKGFQGVEEVTTDSKASKVVVKGKTADPVKVRERLQKKSGRKVELISPLPKPPAESEDKKPEEIKEQEPPKADKKEEPPTPITVVLNVRMHCEACAQALRKRIRKIKGVESVETDLANAKVTVKGIVDPTKLVDDVYKKTRKQVSIVLPEEKKEQDKKEDEEKKKEEENQEKKKEEKEDDDDDESKKNGDMMKRNDYWPSKYYMEYANSGYPPQFFSDENPNACSIM
ncbi:heavy metal-associated isoprenylated plant protein 7-like isoform X2 [Tripterygium wilfordii]|uniref:heavy metal-associated isoprenylated plant protein 7-like isoform X2 n=1 Tax=Tripterygium wilfordii TaxID=458696 RepID=UPI0018F82314|nr:heavy metal-associated isoprenylated plant protein 7-like isoform X2 [Tripterygium wilfordii]